MIKNLLDACGAGIAFFVCGYAFAFGTNEAGALSSSTLAGSDNFLLIGYNVDPALFFFQYAFSATTATIVAGTLAERCQMISYFVYSFTLIAVVYPVIAHSVCKSTFFHGLLEFRHLAILSNML